MSESEPPKLSSKNVNTVLDILLTNLEKTRENSDFQNRETQIEAIDNENFKSNLRTFFKILNMLSYEGIRPNPNKQLENLKKDPKKKRWINDLENLIILATKQLQLLGIGEAEQSFLFETRMAEGKGHLGEVVTDYFYDPEGMEKGPKFEDLQLLERLVLFAHYREILSKPRNSDIEKDSAYFSTLVDRVLAELEADDS